MMAFWIDPVFWNWLILCGVFLLAEVFTVTFFFLTWATAALVMAVVTWLLPTLSWQIQVLFFAVLSLFGLVVWWAYARRFQRDPNDEAGKLNNRGRALLGRQFVLKTPIEQSYGRIQIGDSLWDVTCTEDLPAGTKIVIDGVDGLTLKVSRV